jgi:hypothetical protein
MRTGKEQMMRNEEEVEKMRKDEKKSITLPKRLRNAKRVLWKSSVVFRRIE